MKVMYHCRLSSLLFKAGNYLHARFFLFSYICILPTYYLINHNLLMKTHALYFSFSSTSKILYTQTSFPHVPPGSFSYRPVFTLPYFYFVPYMSDVSLSIVIPVIDHKFP